MSPDSPIEATAVYPKPTNINEALTKFVLFYRVMHFSRDFYQTDAVADRTRSHSSPHSEWCVIDVKGQVK